MTTDDDARICPKCIGSGQYARHWCSWCGGVGRVSEEDRQKYIERHRIFDDTPRQTPGGDEDE